LALHPWGFSSTGRDINIPYPRLGQISEQRGLPRAQIALAWLLSKPGITAPIVGATKSHHLQDAIAALSLRLSPEEIVSLEEPYTPHPVLGFS
jgi:aryl-alcohol dehydrogenase-like predicted oxidoreductase